MKPAPFAYARAKSVEHAIELLARPDGEARLLAGGQSLIATLNMRLSAPKLLIDLNGVNGLKELNSAGHMIDLRFSDPSVHEAQANVWYFSGRKESYKLEQSSRVDTGGRYVFELRDEGDWGV